MRTDAVRHIHLVALIGLVLSACAGAAGTDMEAFDYSRCQRWYLSDQLAQRRDSLPASMRQMIEAEEAGTLSRNAVPMTLGGYVFRKKLRDADGDVAAADVFCVADAVNATGLACFVGDASEARRYSFAMTRPWGKAGPATYTCRAPCTGYPVTHIFQLPWGGGTPNADGDRAGRLFHKRCR